MHYATIKEILQSNMKNPSEEVDESQPHNPAYFQRELQVMIASKPNPISAKNQPTTINTNSLRRLNNSSSRAFYTLDFGMSSSSYNEIGGVKKYVIPDSDKSKPSSLKLIGIYTKIKSSLKIDKTIRHKIINKEIDENDEIKKIFKDHLQQVPSSSIRDINAIRINRLASSILKTQASAIEEKEPDPISKIHRKNHMQTKRRGFVTEEEYKRINSRINSLMML